MPPGCKGRTGAHLSARRLPWLTCLGSEVRRDLQGRQEGGGPGQSQGERCEMGAGQTGTHPGELGAGKTGRGFSSRPAREAAPKTSRRARYHPLTPLSSETAENALCCFKPLSL